MRSTTKLFAVTALFGAGCVGEVESVAPPQMVSARALFDQSVAPVLELACGACHRSANLAPPFLEPKPDLYAAVFAWPGLVAESPELSRLYTKGQHAGPALLPSQAMEVARWIRAEATERSAARSPIDGGPQAITTPPLSPKPGHNEIDLGMLGPDLAGAKLTFDVTIFGGGIELAALKIAAPERAPLRVVHPLFAVHSGESGSPHPDPVDTFRDLDLEVPAHASAPLASGPLVLTEFKALTDRISIAFVTLTTATAGGDADGGAGGGGGGGSGGCKDVAAFTQSARPQLAASCVTCHGGTNVAARGALDMSRVADLSPAGQATACAQVLNKVTPSAPMQSLVFEMTRPGGTSVHPFKFPDATAFSGFQQQVSVWIQKEQ